MAFLGERAQANWWPSSFLSHSGQAFLTPVFPKTSALARVNGASCAAQISHDDCIGIGYVHHLFRLPENIECDISQLLAKDGSVLELILSEERAHAVLQQLAAGDTTKGIGPLIIEGKAIDEIMIRTIAAAYINGFSVGEQVYPYYRCNK